MRKGNLEKKIEEATKVHNGFYDYSLVIENEPNSVRDKVQIICPIHGVFEMSLDNHIGKGHKCPKCSGVHCKTNEEFIDECKEVHKNRNYDFSKVNYVNCKTKVCVICHNKDIFGNEHGEFLIKPTHLKNGHGCPKCAHRYLTNKEWIAMAEGVHGIGRYDYSLVSYSKNQKEKGKFICHRLDEYGNEHGVFEQTYSSHLQGCGCPKCNGGVRYDAETFVKKARRVHGGKYGYDNFVYVNAHTEGLITCPIHGEFLQTPTAHISGEGCPSCKNSILEDKVQRLLESIGEPFQKNVYIGLGKQTIDFYLPRKQLYIECQGEQHYVPTRFSSSIGVEQANLMLEERKGLDKDKYDRIKSLCFNLIYYSDSSTFHNRNVDVKGGWYNDKLVFTNIDNLKSFICGSKNYEYDITENNNDVFENKVKCVTKRVKWDYSACKEEALKYKNKYEMKIKNQSAYNASVRNGWIDIFFPNSQSNRNWNIMENVLYAASKSKNARDMVKKFGGAYNSAVKHNWTDKLLYKKSENRNKL